MLIDARVRAYWREEFSLIALLLPFFIAIVVFGYSLPFDARLFPLIIGCAGIALTLAVALDQVRRRRATIGERPFSIAAVTVKNGKIAEIDFLADPERIAQLDLTEVRD